MYIRIAFKNTNNVGRLFSKLKDKQPIADSTNVVYKVNCNSCQKCYIGMTGQKLAKRMKQHEADTKHCRTGKSALAYHAVTNDHSFDFGGVQILERADRYRKRMLLEELRIKSCSNCVNIKSIESRNVSDIYTNLFMKLEKE